jgi:hypothetical protein
MWPLSVMNVIKYGSNISLMQCSIIPYLLFLDKQERRKYEFFIQLKTLSNTALDTIKKFNNNQQES